MEYGHRMWGRLIGAAFYGPAAYFWARGRLPPFLKPRVAVLGVLLACQGLLGWYMVKSGLDHKNFEGPSDVPRVSQYRLASHLGAAMVFYSLLFWNSLEVLVPATAAAKAQEAAAANILKFRRLAMHCKLFVFATAISGAFVAGLDAGLVYNSFPLMADRYLVISIFSPQISCGLPVPKFIHIKIIIKIITPKNEYFYYGPMDASAIGNKLHLLKT